MWPFGKGQGPDPDILREQAHALGKLRERVATLESEKLAREVAVFEQLTKLDKLIKKLLRSERGAEAAGEPSAGGTEARPAGPPREEPPPGLRGARLRIWRRERGLPTLQSYRDEMLDPEATSTAENGAGE